MLVDAVTDLSSDSNFLYDALWTKVMVFIVWLVHRQMHKSVDRKSFQLYIVRASWWYVKPLAARLGSDSSKFKFHSTKFKLTVAGQFTICSHYPQREAPIKQIFTQFSKTVKIKLILLKTNQLLPHQTFYFSTPYLITSLNQI